MGMFSVFLLPCCLISSVQNNHPAFYQTKDQFSLDNGYSSHHESKSYL